jgi:hypothetical protein
LELAADFTAEALVLKAGDADPAEWVAAWKALTGAPPLFLDPGEEQAVMEGLPAALDPFHCEDPTISPYWRVHGWGEKKAIERYGSKGLQDLARMVLLDSPEWVVLAHAGRVEEAADFKGRLL